MNSELRFNSFIERLKYVIGNEDYTPWAENHNLSPVTVLGWFNGASLYPKSWDKLVSATGIAKDWWLNGQSEPKYDLMVDNQIFELKTKQNNQKYNVEDTVYIESYPEVRGAAGVGQVTPTDQVIVKMAVNAADWRNYVGLDHRHIKIVAVHGDSMKPALSHGDQVLVDTACHSFVDDAIYAIQQGDLTRFKRIKLRLDGSIEVKSDNEKEGFKLETYTAEDAAEFKLIGRVIPFKFGRFDL